MGIGEQRSGNQRSDGAPSSESKSPLQAILARGALLAGDAKEFEAALKHKQEHAERAAELLASRWRDLPRDLQMIVVRWKWQERKAESRAKACLRLGAAVAKTDPVSASGLLGEAMKLLSSKPDPGAKPSRSGSGATPADFRTALREMLAERWLTPLDAAPLFSIRFPHVAREARSELASMLSEAVGGEDSASRKAVVEWLQSQLINEPSIENRHAVDSALKALQGPSPLNAITPRSPAPTTELTKDEAPLTPTSSEVAESKTSPTTALDQLSNVAAPAHPRVLIADALRVIQAEVKRWSSEDGSELQSLRRKAAELEESLKRCTQERDELVTTLGIVRTKQEQLERSVSELSDRHGRALQLVESSETETRQFKQQLMQLEAQHAKVIMLKEQLEQDLGRVKEDKRRAVEYTRDTERAAMAQEIARVASFHLENMKDLLQLDPSKKQNDALQSCHNELSRVLRTPLTHPNG
jgi:hypothetical protein